MHQSTGAERSHPRFPAALLALSMLVACHAPVVSSAEGPADAAVTADAAARASVSPDAPFNFAPADAQPPPAGGTPGATCAAEVHKAQAVTVDVFFLLDASPSMDELAGSKSKWQMVEGALSSFIADPRSAGLSVAVEFFPLGELGCTSDQDCQGYFPGKAAPPGTCQLLPYGLCVPPGGPPTDEICYYADHSCPAGDDCLPQPGLCEGTPVPCPSPGGTCGGILTGRACLMYYGSCLVDTALDCASSIYERPQLEFTALPSGAPAASSTLARRKPGNGTPMQQAVQGALAYVDRYIGAHPDHRGVVVLVTDGRPESDCPEDTTAIVSAVAAAQSGLARISLYTIGVFGPTDAVLGGALLDRMAAAGGTTKAFVLQPDSDLASTALATLEQIRGATLPCRFTIPPPTAGALDYGKVNVHHSSGGGGGEDLGYVPDAAHCDPTRGGWYYDADPTRGGHPTQVVVCPASCTRINSDPQGEVELRFGCKTIVIQ
jgi:Mg-chelatase subunit ChlD